MVLNIIVHSVEEFERYLQSVFLQSCNRNSNLDWVTVEPPTLKTSLNDGCTKKSSLSDKCRE